MFEQKQKTLVERKQETTSGNPFVKAAVKQAAVTKTGNGAIKYEATNDAFVNQFGIIGQYKEARSFVDVSKDMSILWAISPRLTVCFTLFIRMITRLTNLFDGSGTETVQRGAGLQNEGILRMMWIQIYHKDVFWKNVEFFVSVGSWKDIITMLNYDLQYNGWNGRKLDWVNMGKLILAGLENPNVSELIKKYLPKINASTGDRTLNVQADTMIAKWISSLLYGGKTEDNQYWKYRLYRIMKSTGTAHGWQQLISKGKHALIDFGTVHGRALAQLVSGKYLKNQGLQAKYSEWIAGKTVNKETVKFTGYVYELADMVKKAKEKYQFDTINAQYETLLALAGPNAGEWMVVKDTSGSMDSVAHGTNMRSYDIAKSIAIYLANLIQGPFHNHYIDFSSNAVVRQLQGSNFCEYWRNEQRVESANTNFMAIAELLVRVKATIAEKDFPKGIICISDGQFDTPVRGLDYTGKMFDKTNIEAFRIILQKGGFSKEFVENFKFCFWDIHNSFYGTGKAKAKFESHTMEDGVFYMSGFDPSVISFLTGDVSEAKFTEKTAPKNAKELFLASMSQEILDKVEI